LFFLGFTGVRGFGFTGVRGLGFTGTLVGFFAMLSASVYYFESPHNPCGIDYKLFGFALVGKDGFVAVGVALYAEVLTVLDVDNLFENRIYPVDVVPRRGSRRVE
jgi:hypothetical protein